MLRVLYLILSLLSAKHHKCGLYCCRACAFVAEHIQFDIRVRCCTVCCIQVSPALLLVLMNCRHHYNAAQRCAWPHAASAATQPLHTPDQCHAKVLAQHLCCLCKPDGGVGVHCCQLLQHCLHLRTRQRSRTRQRMLRSAHAAEERAQMMISSWRALHDECLLPHHA
jgi:hypothetical protein